MDRYSSTRKAELHNSTQAVRRLGWICLTLIVLLGALAIPLHCGAKTALVGSASLLDGALFGLALAAVTRTRRPILIYLFLLTAAGLLLPLWLEWPSASQDDVHLWRGSPALLSNYFDALRYGLFALSLPYPFARFGFHAPDPVANPAAPASAPDLPLS